MKARAIFGTIALLLSGAQAFAQAAGISPTEIRIATLQDLSGPLAGPGKQALNGMRLRVEEINAKGGIHGRKITLLVEDHGYDPKRAVLSAQKLFGLDGAMLMVAQIGTVTTLATVPVLTQQKVINFFPLTSTREVYEPPSPLKFAFLSSYFQQLGTYAPKLAKQVKASRVCALYQDDEFGLEILRGAEAGLKASGIEMAEKTSYKRGATDFSSQVAKLASARCEMVVLGTVVRETVGAMAEAHKLGFKPVFLGSPGAYSSAVVDLGGKNVEGLYVTMSVEQPYTDSGPAELRRFAMDYKARFSDDATVFSTYGYAAIDLFAQGAQKAGANLTPESFVRALETGSLPATPYGTGELTFSATKRLGSEAVRLSQIRNGRWVVVDP